MKEELLKKAIQGENSEVLDPTTKTVWNLRGVSEEELIATAKEINEKLGYELFDDLDYETLISDFSRVSRERFKYAIEKSEFRNDRLEKAAKYIVLCCFLHLIILLFKPFILSLQHRKNGVNRTNAVMRIR